MSDLKNKYMFLEVEKSPPCATLCGPQRVLSKFSDLGRYNCPNGVHSKVTQLEDVMEIRLTGEEGVHKSTLLKMALLYEALKRNYVPQGSAGDDSLILTHTGED